jgi:uncharacterized membrane protein YhaH (DUF805 family)
MRHRLIGEVTQAGDTSVRYVLADSRQRSRRGAYWQFALCVMALALVIFAYGAVGQFDNLPLSQHAMNILYVPVVGVQVVLSIVALLLTMGAVASERRQQNWDSLRATPDGVSIVLRAHWAAAVFYRLRGLLAFAYVGRAVLIGFLAYDLTAFNGDYLNFLTGGITPEVPPLIGGLFMALSLAAAFVLPLTGLGLDAALGLLLATFVRSRVFISFAQVIVIGLRVCVTLAVFLLGSVAVLIEADPMLGDSPLLNGIGIVLLNGLGDSGLYLLNGAALGDLWLTVPYALLLGVVLLGVALVQAALTEVLLRWAMRRAQRME